MFHVRGDETVYCQLVEPCFLKQRCFTLGLKPFHFLRWSKRSGRWWNGSNPLVQLTLSTSGRCPSQPFAALHSRPCLGLRQGQTIPPATLVPYNYRRFLILWPLLSEHCVYYGHFIRTLSVLWPFVSEHYAYCYFCWIRTLCILGPSLSEQYA